MIRQFLWVVGILVMMVGVILTHYAFSKNLDQKEKLGALVALTKLSSPALSTTYDESRSLEEFSPNPAYPQMQTIDKRVFVYAH